MSQEHNNQPTKEVKTMTTAEAASEIVSILHANGNGQDDAVRVRRMLSLTTEEFLAALAWARNNGADLTQYGFDIVLNNRLILQRFNLVEQTAGPHRGEVHRTEWMTQDAADHHNAGMGVIQFERVR